ncbi:MAG: hypothetical protein NC203_00330 [Firmicutes bacterium]|nr:hypothetical protein [Bacillota bacterium]
MDDMNGSEELVEQTEQKCYYKILDIISHSESKEEIEEKVRALLKK